MRNITYHSLSDYVGGSCITKTFELDGVTYADHLTAISDWLESITARLNDDELREEWIVCDYDNIPSEFVGEYSIDESFFDLMICIDNSHLDAEIFYAGVSLGIQLSAIEDSYYGYFESDTDLGEHCAENLDIPDFLESYFDYERYGRDCSFDYREFDGHYFYNC